MGPCVVPSDPCHPTPSVLQLFELAALIADPRAPRQPVHPDTGFREGEGAAAITAFVALQDVDELMGPTCIIPGTHTAEAHVRFNNRDDGGRERVALLREKPNHVGVSRRAKRAKRTRVLAAGSSPARLCEASHGAPRRLWRPET